MLNKLAINTGAPRNVTAHFISGAIASSIVSGALNYKKYQNAEISKTQFLNDTVKTSLQGGIATAGAIATTNYLGEGKIMHAMTAMSVAATAVYGTQKVYEKLEVQVNKNKEIENAE
jgi:hypothetical protein